MANALVSGMPVSPFSRTLREPDSGCGNDPKCPPTNHRPTRVRGHHVQCTPSPTPSQPNKNYRGLFHLQAPATTSGGNRRELRRHRGPPGTFANGQTFANSASTRHHREPSRHRAAINGKISGSRRKRHGNRKYGADARSARTEPSARIPSRHNRNSSPRRVDTGAIRTCAKRPPYSSGLRMVSAGGGAG